MASTSASTQSSARPPAHAGSAGGAGAAPLPPQRILSLLDVAIPQLETPTAYGFAVGCLAVALVLVPLIYLAILAFLGWLVAWHLRQAMASLAAGPYFLFHLPMAFLGLLLVVFLVKPVFFRDRDDEQDAVILTPEKEPLLFAFVSKLCEVTGAPPPQRIQVDCRANAAAGPMGGFLGLLGGRMTLLIGLPLVSGLPLRAFAGVLAHELGHFTQRSGMTASYLIRRLVSFFGRIVYQRDRLDRKLANLREAPSKAGRCFYYVCAVLVECARGVLWLMLMLAYLLCCGVLRRMEYDADRLEAHLAGTEDFNRTSRLLMFLQVASQGAEYDLQNAWEQRRLADDMPRLIVANARQLAEHRAKLLKYLDEDTTGWFDTHPCHTDRVANVRDVAPLMAGTQAQAKHLFADFPGLCRWASQTYYQARVGKDFASAKLVPTAELVAEQLAQQQAFKALRRFFHGHVMGMRPIFPDANSVYALPDPQAAARTLPPNRQAMVQAAEMAAGASEAYEQAAAGLVVQRAHIVVFSLVREPRRVAGVRGKAERELRRLEARHSDALDRLAGLEEAARQRLTAALRLLATPSAHFPLPDRAALHRSAAALIPLCPLLESSLVTVKQLFTLAVRLRVLCAYHNDRQPYQPLVDQVLSANREVAVTLQRLQGELGRAAFPFEHAVAGISIGNALVTRLPEGRDPWDCIDAAMRTHDRFMMLVYRTLARLTEIAEKVEAALGLAPLPDPPEKQDTKQQREEQRQVARKTRKYWIGHGTRAAGGIALLTFLVHLSISPPSLPALGWPNPDHSQYQPAPFRMTSPSYAPRPAPTWAPPTRQPPPTYRPPDSPAYRPPNPPAYRAPTPPGYRPPAAPTPRR